MKTECADCCSQSLSPRAGATRWVGGPPSRPGMEPSGGYIRPPPPSALPVCQALLQRTAGPGHPDGVDPTRLTHTPPPPSLGYELRLVTNKLLWMNQQMRDPSSSSAVIGEETSGDRLVYCKRISPEPLKCTWRSLRRVITVWKSSSEALFSLLDV